ncbi:hypothetical protein SAMN05192533_105117 [Mesobacillus persicus]|uniref:PEGA domain-containing protein n=1 Tax=Mesobacillus persicus TaxID=930146 RepID=A0A1H8AR33_9BACI|nr:hypothetical protein [Mesobacillus persicus]SEM72976.1 hypothetical protein SAMN05192533_105117 [Mesobacillus persicus]
MIRIKRETSYPDRLRDYKVIVDEKEVGSLGSGGTLETSISPGFHTLYLKIDWCTSNKIEFEVQEEETLEFTCGGLSGLKFLAVWWFITFGRHRYLWIKQITT